MSNVVDITLPEEQREGTQATLQQWLVAVGDNVVVDQPLAELETDKVTMEVCAPCSGVVQELLVTPGCGIEPDTVLGRLGDEADTQTSTATAAPVHDKQSMANASSSAVQIADNTDNTESARHLVGPAVRRLLRENALDIELIPGTGRNGRVTRDDVMAFLANPQPRKSVANMVAGVAASRSVTTNQTATSGSLQGRLVPHTAMRKSIASHMVDSLLHTAPHVTSVFEMDMSHIIEHRRWHKKEFSEKGVKLTFTAYFLAACVKAINTVPEINARFHDDALEIFDHINIGVGTALGKQGLVVPVIADVQNKDLLDIAQALQKQTHKAREGKLVSADMKNGTFTVSNHGVSGSLLATPVIINQPQVAILGVGKLDKRVVVVNHNGEDSMVIKPMCYVSLSIDHRAVDAFQANQFLNVFVQTIEHWGE